MNARVTAFLAAVAVAVGASEAAPVVHRDVHRALQASNKVDIMVTMKAPSKVLENFQPEAYTDRVARTNALKAELEKVNGAAVKPLASLLSKEAGTDVETKSFWIQPMVAAKNVDAELLEKILALDGVAEIREEKKIHIQPIVERRARLEAIQGREWGVERIGAHKVWADGTSGQNVLVGAIDSGARATHEALKKNFLGKYGWYDPEKRAAEPYDNIGHGTHVIGTIAGNKGLGVAPSAKWMMCKACRTEDCPESDLVECGQFMLCPTLANGTNHDCSRAPRIVSNSWGGGQGDNWYKPVVDAWIKAGMIPVFAIGNEGYNCSTASSPGDYPNVIGVGATANTDKLAWFSSRGPSLYGRIKPDISAPGQDVRSAWNTGDSDYETISGTSMATPHVSGAIALLLSQEPDLTLDEIKVRLYTTTDQNLPRSSSTCGGTLDANWPNNQYGHGRMNIFTAYQGFRPAPTPAPTTPAPTTVTPAPTPSYPVNKYDAECKRLWMKELCPANSHCIWSDARNLCIGNPDFKEPTN